MSEKVIYIVRVAMKDKTRLDFTSKKGTKEEAKELFDSFIKQLDEEKYDAKPYIIGPSAIVIKSEISYIGIESIELEEEEE